MTEKTTQENTKKTTRKASSKQKPLIEKYFTVNEEDAFAQVEWSERDALIGVQENPVFYQPDVEFPINWSQNAVNIVSQKYFAYKETDPHRERSLKTLINRVVDKIADAGESEGYFNKEDREIFANELRYILVNQMAAFNSPVWFNVGVAGSRQQVSACFILEALDNIESIDQWINDETKVFRFGSGAGVNLSNLRASNEPLSKGGTSSGPIAFMRAADANAGTIKSGGIKRRAAKLVCLDANHPDIEDFIVCKAREEERLQILKEAGYDVGIGSSEGERNLAETTSFQNANNSVRVTDEFMEAVENDEEWELISRLTGEVKKKLPARKLMKNIAKSAWRCADPGLQYDTTINDWHTTPAQGRIEASNPCAEYVSNNNTSCNLASINLKKFLKNGKIDIQSFIQTVKVMILAQEITISFADFPTSKLTKNTRNMRQLGLGYANLGGLLMSMGIPYDSDKSREIAASLASLMTAEAYSQSVKVAEKLSPFKHYEENKDSMQRVLKKHRQEANNLYSKIEVRDSDSETLEIARSARKVWNNVTSSVKGSGIRNAQISLMAPTGTISLMMDCDTTGVEPDFALIKHKVLAGGGTMNIINNSVAEALYKLGYSGNQISKIKDFILKNNSVVDAPGLKLEHYSVFDCAVGNRSISPSGHLDMLEAIQPHVSGAISKTINLPEDTTVEEIEDLYIKAWKKGIKSVALYRDGSKGSQPLTTKTKKESPALSALIEQTETINEELKRGERRPMAREANVKSTSFRIGDSSGYCHVRLFDDGTPGALFIDVGQAGSTLHGFIHAWAVTLSLGLQYGMPLDHLVRKLAWAQFEPSGITDDPDIRIARSIVDYIVRWLAKEFLPVAVHRELGIGNGESLNEQLAGSEMAPIVNIKAPTLPSAGGSEVYGSYGVCRNCGGTTQQAGTCLVCTVCGETTGCG